MARILFTNWIHQPLGRPIALRLRRERTKKGQKPMKISSTPHETEENIQTQHSPVDREMIPFNCNAMVKDQFNHVT
ncbi:Uncharacterized protein TCM_014286 [Theobroma cacao]|uniref:Uncharacterized protein n=1 Tax=Theobroma cacao TaxID=3641 RepID=A0A061FYX5_THECC|nr:Uncharacterized protein TCM_014286 [Theobroma cacao]